MAQQASISSFSKAERYVILERVFDFISDIRTLRSLTLVSKEIRSAVYMWNGLRVLTLKYDLPARLKLNGVTISGKSIKKKRKNRRAGVDICGKRQNKKLKDGLRWIWTVGKRLNSVCLDGDYESRCLCDIVLPLFNSLTVSEKRRIESIHISRGMHCEFAFRLVRENCSTLRRLCVEFWDQSSVDSLCSLVTRMSVSGSSERESFWSVVQQCERLDSLNLILCDSNDPIFPLELVNLLRHTPFKHFGLDLSIERDSKTETIREVVGVLSVENLRENLKSLEFNSTFSVCVLCPLVEELAGSPSPMVFVNVTELTIDFLGLCCQQIAVNWLEFWTIFPALHVIQTSILGYPHLKPNSCLSQNVFSFCKTYLEVSASRSCHIAIVLPVKYFALPHRREQITALANVFSLPDDQDWCTSHGVQIETERRKRKAKKVTLRKDTTTLVFHFKQTDE